MSSFTIDPSVVSATRATLALLADDSVNKPALMAYLDGPGPHAELRTVLRALAREIKPKSHFEIGVRLGWSLAQVVAECPTCHVVACDPWLPGYGGVANPGADFVRNEVFRVSPDFCGTLSFTNDYSWTCLPEMVASGLQFDLICVDGDHTGAGATNDLLGCLNMLKPGGALVFDDLVPFADDPYGSLLGAWRSVQADFPEMTWQEVPGLIPVGIARLPK